MKIPGLSFSLKRAFIDKISENFLYLQYIKFKNKLQFFSKCYIIDIEDFSKFSQNRIPTVKLSPYNRRRRLEKIYKG